MELFINLFYYKDSIMEEPSAFGGLHLLSVLLVILVSVIACVFLKDVGDVKFRFIIGCAFGVMLIYEVWKQIAVGVDIVDGVTVISYSWSTFPFQLCSTPLYVLPFMALLPDCDLRDIFSAYIMCFTLVGGIAVFIFPKTVFTTYTALNAHTMVHHGLQITTAVYTAAYYRKRLNGRFFIGGACLFTVFFIIANLLNTVGYNWLVAKGLIVAGDTFNMFHISPRADQTLPALSALKELHPSLVIVGYYVFMTLFALAVFFAARYIPIIIRKISGKKCYAKK